MGGQRSRRDQRCTLTARVRQAGSARGARLLHNLLLLHQESAHDAVAHRATAQHAAVRAVHRLLVVRHALAAVLRRAQARHLRRRQALSDRPRHARRKGAAQCMRSQP